MMEQDLTATRSDVFFSRYGLRSGWRCLLFILLLTCCIIGTQWLLRSFIGSELPLPSSLLATEGLATLSVLFSTWIMARFVDHKPFTSFGLAAVGGTRRFLFGLATGYCALSLLLLALDISGATTFKGLALHGTSIWTYGVLWAVVFLFVGLSEELIARGYLLFALTQGLGFWPAAALVSLLFAAGHIHNPGESAIGIAAAGLIGLVLAWSVKRTGSLWWAIGFHTAWDWAESFFYGTADSGGVLPLHLLNTSPRGAPWLSGGSVGPEGSIFVLPVVFVVALTIRLLHPTPAPELRRLV
jgi:membrane protease YdiL (CAAX protease family)